MLNLGEVALAGGMAVSQEKKMVSYMISIRPKEMSIDSIEPYQYQCITNWCLTQDFINVSLRHVARNPQNQRCY